LTPFGAVAGGSPQKSRADPATRTPSCNPRDQDLPQHVLPWTTFLSDPLIAPQCGPGGAVGAQTSNNEGRPKYRLFRGKSKKNFSAPGRQGGACEEKRCSRRAGFAKVVGPIPEMRASVAGSGVQPGGDPSPRPDESPCAHSAPFCAQTRSSVADSRPGHLRQLAAEPERNATFQQFHTVLFGRGPVRTHAWKGTRTNAPGFFLGAARLSTSSARNVRPGSFMMAGRRAGRPLVGEVAENTVWGGGRRTRPRPGALGATSSGGKPRRPARPEDPPRAAARILAPGWRRGVGRGRIKPPGVDNMSPPLIIVDRKV